MKYLAGNDICVYSLSTAELTTRYYCTARFADKARTFNALRSFLHRENDKDIKLLRNAIDLNRTYKQVYAAMVRLNQLTHKILLLMSRIEQVALQFE